MTDNLSPQMRDNRHVWQWRPDGFLEEGVDGFEKERLSYIYELHQVIWKLLRVLGISWSGKLDDCVVRTLTIEDEHNYIPADKNKLGVDIHLRCPDKPTPSQENQ